MTTSRPALPRTPRVAVCIPAYDEVEGIARTVASVLDVDYPKESLQVVVAVDGAAAATVCAAREAGATVVPLAVNRGSYAARNAAVAALERPVDVVLFTDADCVAGPDWVNAQVEALRGADTCGGAVRFTFEGAPTPAEFVDSVRHLQQQGYVTRDGFAVTCNLGVRIEVYDHLRFDESMRTGGDADFGRRAREAGYTIVYSEDAWIEHPARRTDGEVMQKVARIAAGVEGQRSRWEARKRPVTGRPHRGVWKRARSEGHDVSWAWGVHAALLDWWATRTINKAVHAMLDRNPP
ncbi:MAG: glycosyl transferase, group 2 family protein [Frankiales bacterium]|jgi:glycosyltransferase involved in cell wall biosynthesis|nr:glycosyl transferase, group 2 family protein [Frankiales bacterium]